MMNQFLSRLAFLLLVTTPFVTLAPVYAEASTTSAPTTSAVSSTGTIDASSLVVSPGIRPRLTGTANVSKILITITASSTTSSNVLYKGSRVTVHNGTWHVDVSQRFVKGTYTVTLYADSPTNDLTQLATGTLYVGVTPVASAATSTLKVLPIALLAGGVAPAGSTQPISYLQVINESHASTTIKGFWIKEDGNAPVSSIIGFSTVDDKGGNRTSVSGTVAQPLFVNGQAYVPSGAVIGPMQMKLFTIKAQLSPSAGQYAGTDLMLDVAGVDAQATFLNTFPIRGTTWVISK